ncbi:GDP-mannose 4,6-dehydratase [bacterium]|nr:GDP-mannose 4,6-dehydratase [bacterium]
MRILVTGVSGFIGSHLASRLLEEGHEVIGMDSFTSYYSIDQKKANLAELTGESNFRFLRADLLTVDLDTLLSDIDVVFHLAAQAGVRASWGHHFKEYTRNNIDATQELLEAARNTGLTKFIHASSSSVYGEVKTLPVKETHPLVPVSPYGVTKLAAEHLCSIYAKSFGVPIVMLRFFTVYGPRQRPDMAFHKFIKAGLDGLPIEVYGDGTQTRDFTYVKDIVEACVLSMNAKAGLGPYNIGGGARVRLSDVVEIIQKLLDVELEIKNVGKQRGDVLHTHSDCSSARANLGYSPKFSLEEGLFEEIAWLRSFNS